MFIVSVEYTVSVQTPVGHSHDIRCDLENRSLLLACLLSNVFI